MAVQFILGRSGTGKTSYCINAIADSLLQPADNQSPLLLLVPEQATFQAEHAILSDKRISGYSRLKVLSFDRLAKLLLSSSDTTATDFKQIGQQMIVHRILRDNISKLKVFNRSATSPGMGRQMAEIIAELHQYAKTPHDIDQLLRDLQKNQHNHLTFLKFTDISLVFKEYLKFIEGKFIDPDIQLIHACRAIASSELAKGTKLWVDGFSSFTLSELAILTELIKAASTTQIALCMDALAIDFKNPCAASTPETVSLFNVTEQTYNALIKIVKKCKLKLAEPIILDTAVKFSSCPSLAHIERSLFTPEPAKIKPSDNIRIVPAPDSRAEVQFVARQIIKLVKKNGYRYRDIAVIASDIDHYQYYIRAYFNDYAIPFFIDKRQSLGHHPAVELICSVLQTVTSGFSSNHIFAYLKTGLVPIEASEVDMLENYCLAFGVEGADWTSEKEWQFDNRRKPLFDEKLINKIRWQAISPLLEFRDRFCPSDNPAKMVSAEEFITAIFDFLDRLKIRETIEDWIKEADERKDFITIDKHQQFYNKLIDTFDEFLKVFGGQKMTCRDFLAIINSAFSQLSLAFIPPTLDQVLVGSIERSRHPDLKAVFLIGATQKSFPIPINYSGILTDDDRRVAMSASFQLAATREQRLAERWYLAYIAFTRASQFLCVTCPSSDDKGNAVARSQFIANIESLFENLEKQSTEEEQICLENVCNQSELADILCTQLGKSPIISQSSRNNHWTQLLEDIRSDEQFAELGSRIENAINYNNYAQLDKTIVGELFGQQIKSSATGLKTFAQCPYQYFAKYILNLEKRKESKLRPLDIGDFYHRILDALLKQLNAEKKDFASIGDDELLELLREQISKTVIEDCFISNFARHNAHNEFIIYSAGELIEDCVLAIAQMIHAGRFQPKRSEVTFGKAGKGLGEYKIALSKGQWLSLRGKIDRLDIAELDGQEVVIVFDYKRKDKSFRWSEFYHGLDIQLPIYMLAVRNASSSKYKTCKIAGAFYMPIETKVKSASVYEISENSDSFDYKARGIFDGDFAQQLDTKALKSSKFYNFYVTKDGQPYGLYDRNGALKPPDFEKLLRFAEKKVAQLAREILSGKIDIKPYRLGSDSACGFCEYKPLCRFDWRINTFNFLESANKPRVLGEMEGIDG